MPDSALCILCPNRGRAPRRPPVCDACRQGIVATLGDLRIYTERLVQSDDLVPDRARTIERNGVRVWHYDPIAEALPSGAGAIRIDSAPVSGSRERILPIDVDRVDLTLAARAGELTRTGKDLAQRYGDQVGQIPLASTLEMWVRDWAHERRETPPVGRVESMTRWLQRRVDWACDTRADIGEFVAAIQPYWSTMRHRLYLDERPERKVGVSCPRCRNQSLIRHNSKWVIECRECPAVLSWSEYQARAIDNVVCRHCVRVIEETLSIPAAA